MSEHRWKVNDRERTVTSEPGDSVLDVVRRLGLTGTKRVCGAGACGACTVLVDEEPTAACLVPADSVNGQSVRTVEGIADDSAPNAVQRALLAADAVQCGYCTPGFVVAATAFRTRWRAEHGAVEPPAHEVHAALAGNACRCGCQLRIVEAVRRACAGEVYDPPVRHDALAKVTGRAVYTADVRLDGQLDGVLVRSPHPHALVRRVDEAAARAVPGVRAVVRLVEPGERVRFAGQEVAAVAADSPAAARAGAAALVVDYQVLPFAVSDPAGPPVYDGRDRRKAPSAGEVPDPFGRWRWEGNVRSPRRTGPSRAVRRAFAGPGPEVRGTYSTGSQSHVPLEPHACVAHWRADELLVHLSTQAVSYVAGVIARRYRLRRDRVRVVAEHVGGAFGAKQDLTAEAVAAIELSRAAGQPVRVVLDLAEELTAGGHRPAATAEVRLKLTGDGDLAALDIDATAEGGTAVGSDVARVAGLLYPGPPRRLVDRSLVSNTAPGKPFRAPSGPTAFWALEQAVDEAAALLSADPLDLRSRWDRDPNRRRLYDWVREATPWPGPAPGGGRVRRGYGLAAATWHYYLQPLTKVRVRVRRGAVEVDVAVPEIGTGARTLLAGEVAGALGLAPGEVVVLTGDSRLVPGPVAAGSSLTASLGPAAHDAATRLRDRLAEAASRRFGLVDAVAAPDGVRHGAGLLPWRAVLREVEVTVVGRRPRDRGPRPRPWYSPAFGEGRGQPSVVQVSEVEVDLELGTVQVPRVWCGLSVGRVAHPVMATTQVHGAVVQAIGQTLYEERRVDPGTGRTLTTDLEDYALPGLADVPEIEVGFVGEGFDHVPRRAVGLAEVAALAAPASIGNAVHAATGHRYRRLPLTPRTVLEGLR